MSEPTIILFIARHGQTVLNASNCFRGNKDPSLDASGFRDAHHLAAYFKDEPLSFIVSSDKLRARQTAGIIKGDKDLDVHETPNLRALNVGDFSGKKRTPEAEAELQHYIDNPDIDIPGGESLNEFKSRIRPALWEAFEIADDAGKPGLLVAHSSIVHECGSWIYNDHKATLVEPGGVLAVYVQNGKIGAEPIFRPVLSSDTGTDAKTVS
jgi:broad specificity phosphatase PhoE